MNLDRLEWHLENWASCSKGGNDAEIAKHGYPKASLMLMGGGAVGEDDTEIAGDAADANAASSIDSIIYSLRKPQVTAIEYQYGISKHSWPTHEMDLLEGKEAIIKIAMRRGIF